MVRQKSSAALLTLGIASLIGYALVARSVSRRRTAAEDHKLRDNLQAARDREGEAMAKAVGPIGKQWLHIPATAAVSWYLWRREAGPRSVVPLAASVTSDILSRVFDRLPPNRQPPPGHPDQHKTTFPSGHANETTAVTFTTAYVLAREGVVAPAPAFAIAAVLSIASPAGRMYLDRHWATDVVAGWCLGLATAAGCAAIYETAAANCD